MQSHLRKKEEILGNKDGQMKGNLWNQSMEILS